MTRPLGYDVDDNAIRFSNYFHVLRELVHFTNGWMPLEPSWERKYALGDHVHDDARALTKIKRRLYELRHPSEYPGSPSPELEALLDRMASAADRAGVPDGRLHRGQAGARSRDADPPRQPRPGRRRALAAPADPDRRAPGAPHGRARQLRRRHRHVPRAAARRAARAAHPAAARGAAPGRLRGGHRDRRPVPLARPVRERRREPRAGGARGAAALLPRTDGRRAVGGRADGAQLARAPRDAVGLPRGHGAPELGRGAPRAAARPADEGRARLRLGRLPGRASPTSSRSTRTTCSAACACSTGRASSARCGATRTGARR